MNRSTQHEPPEVHVFLDKRKDTSAWLDRFTLSMIPSSALIFSSIRSRCCWKYFDTYSRLLRSSSGVLLEPARIHFSFSGHPLQSPHS